MLVYYFGSFTRLPVSFCRVRELQVQASSQGNQALTSPKKGLLLSSCGGWGWDFDKDCYFEGVYRLGVALFLDISIRV